MKRADWLSCKSSTHQATVSDGVAERMQDVLLLMLTDRSYKHATAQGGAPLASPRGNGMLHEKF